jgi:hypothetical protein
MKYHQKLSFEERAEVTGKYFSVKNKHLPGTGVSEKNDEKLNIL